MLYPKFSYSHHKNILSLPQLLYMYVLQLLTLNFGTVLKLDKQNKLKTSEIKLHLATTEQAATSMFLRRPCRPRMRALRCLLTIGTGSAYPVWRNASTKAKKRENQRLGNLITSCKSDPNKELAIISWPVHNSPLSSAENFYIEWFRSKLLSPENSLVIFFFYENSNRK